MTGEPTHPGGAALLVRLAAAMAAGSAAAWLLAAAEVPWLGVRPRFLSAGAGVLVATALAPSVRGPLRAFAAWCALAVGVAAAHYLVLSPLHVWP